MTSKSTLNQQESTAGFTLIEVMISIVLLVMISLAIYQATTQTYKYRAKIINEGDFYSGIRLAMGLMDRDVAALFSPVNFNPNAKKTDPNQPDQVNTNIGNGPGGILGSNLGDGKSGLNDTAQMDTISRTDLGKLSDFWLPATDITAIRPSRFVGTDTKISFVTASHMRLYKNFRESEYAKVIYELHDDKDSAEQFGSTTKLLVKIEDANVFDDDKSMKNEKYAKVYPLLPGVTSMKFRYFRAAKNPNDKASSWEPSWDSSKDDMKGLYPDLVELKIEVKGVAGLSFKGTYMFKPETPFYGMDASF